MCDHTKQYQFSQPCSILQLPITDFPSVGAGRGAKRPPSASTKGGDMLRYHMGKGLGDRSARQQPPIPLPHSQRIQLRPHRRLETPARITRYIPHPKPASVKLPPRILEPLISRIEYSWLPKIIHACLLDYSTTRQATGLPPPLSRPIGTSPRSRGRCTRSSPIPSYLA